MPKQGIMFALFICLLAIVCLQSESLLLSFYVLFPTLLFPVFYFFDHRQRGWFFIGSVICVSIVYAVYAIRIYSFEVLLFMFILVFFFWFFVMQRTRLASQYHRVLISENETRSELDQLKNKHQTRLESLRHLEKQVAGLLDLFEIARDFSERMSMRGIAELLYQKVLPELPFEEMLLIQSETGDDGNLNPAVYEINQKGINHEVEEISKQQQTYLDLAIKQKEVVKEKDVWIFPLVSEQKMSACLVVKGADTEDLAKFEVLSAYLALQVKKVKLYETVKELSIRDELTGVFVRRHFIERFEEELRRSLKHQLPLAVLMLDIDHFKRYNDDYGHLAGDSVLKQVTDLLRENLRKVDIVARYGGEEFIVILPESGEEGAVDVAERIRSHVARNQFKVFHEKTRVTISIGIALFPDDVKDRFPVEDYGDLSFDLVQQADKALYRAKEDGRNRVVLAKDL